jgi:hypothetical protein
LSSLSLTFSTGTSLRALRFHRVSDAIDPNLNLNI